MADTPNPEEIARHYLEFWQHQFAGLTRDPQVAESIARMFDLMTAGATTFAKIVAGQATGAEGPSADAKGAGAAASAKGAAATEARLDQIARRVAELERRIARLEPRASARRPGPRGRPRRPRRPS
jgi:hypothetical protein